VFATDGLALAAMLEPCYDNGGDALDYAVNDRMLHLAVFDAMGHGLAAAGVAAFALSAYRYSRRNGSSLLETYASMHEAVGGQYPDSRYVTALIAQLDLDTGRLTWVSAGHPPPLVIRGARRRPHAQDHPGAAARRGIARRPADSRFANPWSPPIFCCSTPTGSPRRGPRTARCSRSSG
jgi:serine phosphatase RsbU (regulator of sigma subunit)